MKKFVSVLLSTVVCGTLASAKVVQQFEPEKDTSSFSGKPEVSFAIDLSFYYQGIDAPWSASKYASHVDYNAYGTSSTDTVKGDTESALSLPTANLDINAKVMSGFNVKLQTMLASHHHNETYVKGGYATIDNLDFIAPGFLSGFMKDATIKIGVNDINYGDDQYRRTDNANVMRNPFINNLAVDAADQGTHIEVLYRIPAISSFVVAGITNGQANPQDTLETDSYGTSSNRYALYGKVGFDHEYNDDWRLRITESVYNVESVNRQDLYLGDKSGNVIRNVYGTVNTNVLSSGWDPTRNYVNYKGTKQYTSAPDLLAAKTNLFVKYKDTELYGMYEMIDAEDTMGKSIKVNHYAIDLVQRFYNDKFWIAGRYENAVQEYKDSYNDLGDAELTQYQATLGWFLSKNAVAKIEYIDQEREKFSIYRDGKASFNGFMVNASLSF